MKKDRKPYHFILVDDNNIDLFFHERLLKLMHIADHICSFSDAHKALDFLETFHKMPDKYPSTVLLLDIQMPDINGFDFLDLMKGLPTPVLEKTFVFMVSSSLDYGDISRCEAHDMIRKLLKKPLNGEELKAALREIRPKSDDPKPKNK